MVIPKYDIICPYCCNRFDPQDAHFRAKGNIKLIGNAGEITDSQIKNIVKDFMNSGSESISSQPGGLLTADPGGTAKNDSNAAFEYTTTSADGKRHDELLYLYYTKTLKYPKDSAYSLAKQFQAFKLNEPGIIIDDYEMSRKGYVSSISFNPSYYMTDTWDTNIRLCPYCHNVLHTGAGSREMLLISVIGDTHAGKSVYLSVLFEELTRDTYFNASLDFIGDRTAKKLLDENYTRPIYEHKQMPRSTEKEIKIPPFLFSYTYTYCTSSGDMATNMVDIVFYDIAGENCRELEKIEQVGFNIKDSNGIIFLLDPMSLDATKTIFGMNDKSLLKDSTRSSYQMEIFTTLYNYFLGTDKYKSEIPLALVLTKSDVFRNSWFDYLKNTPDSKIISGGSEHKGYMDIKTMLTLDDEVKNLINYLGGVKFTISASNKFNHYSCFAVSSLGQNPVRPLDPTSDYNTPDKGRIYILGKELAPFRVTDPFYWLLMKNGLINIYDNGTLYIDGDQPTINTRKKDSGKKSKKSFLERIFG